MTTLNIYAIKTLGRGGSEGCSVPQNVEKLNGIGICQIECGAQFSLALSKNGLVWTWGKGDYFRLGHGCDQHVRKPTVVESLRGKKIVHVAVGALHCLGKCAYVKFRKFNVLNVPKTYFLRKGFLSYPIQRINLKLFLTVTKLEKKK